NYIGLVGDSCDATEHLRGSPAGLALKSGRDKSIPGVRLERRRVEEVLHRAELKPLGSLVGGVIVGNEPRVSRRLPREVVVYLVDADARHDLAAELVVPREPLRRLAAGLGAFADPVAKFHKRF